MTSLIFCDLPPGPTPLFLGEAAENVAEVGRLVLDHATRTVQVLPNNPFETRIIPEHSRQRYAVWEIEAMMPHRQLRELYEDAKPLLERLQMGTTLVRTEERWVRARTPEADAADLVIGDLTAEPAIAPIEWVASPRPVRQETALEKALRLHGAVTPEVARAQFLAGMAEIEREGAPLSPDERHLRNIIAHGRWPVLAIPGNHDLPTQSAGSPGKSKLISLLHVSDLHYTSSTVDLPTSKFVDIGSPRSTFLRKPVEGAMSSRASGLRKMVKGQYKRAGANDQWAKLLRDDGESSRFAG